MDTDLLRVATIGPAHGLGGDVRLQLHTDDPDDRFQPGTELTTDPDDAGPLTVHGLRRHQGQYLVRFEGHEDRNAAEALRGVVLLAPPHEEDDAWYPHQLTGLLAVDPAGEQLGTIGGVQHLPAHDTLVLRTTDDAEVLVPFVHQIVPHVDLAAGRVVIDAPSGLLGDDEPDPTKPQEPTR